MDWNIIALGFFDELEKIGEAKKPVHEKVVDTGAHVLGGAGVGKTLSDLSWAIDHGASPRRKTIGAVIGGAAGLLYHRTQQSKKKRRAAAKSKTAAPFVFKGTATSKFLSKPGKSVRQLSPKIGRKGVLPT